MAQQAVTQLPRHSAWSEWCSAHPAQGKLPPVPGGSPSAAWGSPALASTSAFCTVTAQPCHNESFYRTHPFLLWTWKLRGVIAAKCHVVAHVTLTTKRWSTLSVSLWKALGAHMCDWRLESNLGALAGWATELVWAASCCLEECGLHPAVTASLRRSSGLEGLVWAMRGELHFEFP